MRRDENAPVAETQAFAAAKRRVHFFLEIRTKKGSCGSVDCLKVHVQKVKQREFTVLPFGHMAKPDIRDINNRRLHLVLETEHDNITQIPC